ncbi:sensor histidine kinase [Campylobacter geochelonis]|uniref:sensor histidine kinase n=1 Tax=Campylobacter geochelonis TaxID=1780362 RepID=UPI00077084DF|nr:ATP-binding protein [Campylobacter geochelonis]CZE46668.1 multi-sensor signal transduction histidine kinase [Campylobacter geochelonis]
MKFVFLSLFLPIFLFAQGKEILLLQSYNKGLKWSDDISLGVENELKSYKNIELTTEYMDSKKNDSKEYKEKISKLFLYKFKDRKYDVVIIADNFAVDFYNLNKDKLFTGSKVIFTGLDMDFLGVDLNQTIKDKIPIVLENKQVDTNVAFIISSVKNLKHLYIINDNSFDSRLINDKFKAIEQQNNIDISLNLNGNLQTLEKDIANLPKNSAILFGSLFVDDKMNYISYNTVNNLINSSKFPVFSLTDSHLGKGVVGGLLSTGYEQGSEAGKLALKYLNNQEVDYKTPVLANAKWEFDYNAIKKYNLEYINLPKNATILNAPKSFFEKNRVFIDRSFIASPFIFLILLFIIFYIVKKSQMQKKIADREKLIKTQLNNIKDMILWIRNDGLIITCNQAFCFFISKKKDLIIGKKIDQIIGELNEHIDMQKLFDRDFFEFEYNDKNYYVKNNILEYSNQKTNFLIITDVTAKRQIDLNKQFLIQQSKLSEIGEMLSSLAHQWKTPLVELSAVAHKMQYYNQSKKLTSSDMEQFFDTIMKQIIFMSETVDAIRNFVKPSTKTTLFDIDLGIKEILSIIHPSLEHNFIKVEYKNILDSDIYIYGYANEFKQVILNIINNAKDAIVEKNDKKGSGKIKISLNQIDESVKIKIEDNGVGLSKDSANSIFQPYFTTKKDGLGIGLYMAKFIVENKMDGKLNVYALENGVKFIITLPKPTHAELNDEDTFA